MESFQEFLSMGGYARYVWPTYGAAFAVLLYNVLVPIWRKKRVEQTLARRLRREESHES